MIRIILLLGFLLPSLCYSQTDTMRMWFDEDDQNAVLKTYTNVSSILVDDTLSTSSLTVGFHQLNVTYNNGVKQSPTQSHLFYKTPFTLNNQKVNTLEYWIDENYLDKTTRQYSPNVNIDGDFLIRVGNLKVGLHQFHFRSFNGTKHSPVATHLFYKHNVRVFGGSNRAYYWFDNDTANVESKVIIGNTLITDLDASKLANGLHTCHIYFQNSRGLRSPVESNLFTKGDVLKSSEPWKILDPNPVLVDTDGSILFLENKILDLQSRIGTVTDSISKLILCKETSESVVIEIPFGDGTLSTFANDQPQQKLTLTPQIIDGKSYVIAIYTPPSLWDEVNRVGSDVGKRIVPLKWSFIEPGLKPESLLRITLSVPPVVLVHGMWGSSNSWHKLVDRLESEITPNVYTANYKQHGASSFDPEQSFDLGSISPSTRKTYDLNDNTNYGVPSIMKSVDFAITNLRNQGFACAQVDIIGHSLGGLMAKSFIKQSFLETPYNDISNYYLGYVNRLITIGTPHIGSPFGKKYIDLVGLTGSNAQYIRLKQLLERGVGKLGICHWEFSSQSGAVTKLSNVSIPSHAIIGDLDNSKLWPVGIILDEVIDYDATFYNSVHDGIVGIKSQLGGKQSLSKDVTIIKNVCHSSKITKVTELSSDQILNRVIYLLNSSSKQLWGSGFNYSPEPIISSPFSSTNFLDESNSKIEFLYPQINSTVSVSDQQIRLELNVWDSSIDTVKVIIEEFEYTLTRSDSFKTIISTESVRNTIGPIFCIAIAIDNSGKYHSDSRSFLIKNPYDFFDIKVNANFVELDSFNPIYDLSVIGNYFKTKWYAVDITNTSSGISYEFINGNNIAHVTSEGIVIGDSIGLDTLLVSYRDYSKKIPVRVNSISKKNLLSVSPKEKINKSSFTIFPNPTNGQLTIDYRHLDFEPTEVVVRDIHGSVYKRILISANSRTAVMQTDKVPSGLYLITLKNQRNLITKKVVVTK